MPIITLDFKRPMLNFNTGLPILSATPEEIEKLGIKPTDTSVKVEQLRDQISKYTLATALNQMFDHIPLATNHSFSLYNDTLIKIRHAMQSDKNTIGIEKEDLKKFIEIFTKTPPTRSDLNKTVAFIIEILEDKYAKGIALPPPEIS